MNIAGKLTKPKISLKKKKPLNKSNTKTFKKNSVSFFLILPTLIV